MLIHARQRPEGLRFRMWSTIADAYCGPPLERAAFVSQWAVGHDVTAERLDRAAATGTSSLTGDHVDSLAEWDTEVCGECGGFHHAYEKRGGMGVEGLCSQCGEPQSDRAHDAPCISTFRMRRARAAAR